MVELNNLQRQIIHSTQNIGNQKVASAKEKIITLNPDVNVTTFHLRLTSENILEIINQYDIIIDGSDNFPTRYLVNDACVITNKPLAHAAILKFIGQAMTIIPRQGPCYRCLFPDPPPPGMVPSCQEAGVLGAVAGILGLIQATEVMKFILGKGDLLLGKLLVFDALDMSFAKVDIKRKNDCPVCGDQPTVTALIDYEEFCGTRARACQTNPKKD
jgi:adenylyltransferase/sulfurtransferase